MELWKSTYIDCLYEVSNQGRVRSVDRDVVYKNRHGGHTMTLISSKVLVPYLDSAKRYFYVRLGDRKKYSVHSLVARAFVNGHKEGLEVNHKDNICSNNNKDNLEWVTHSENLLHVRHVIGKQWGHPSKPVIGVNSNGEAVSFASKSLADKGGYDKRKVTACINGEILEYKGLKWSQGE